MAQGGGVRGVEVLEEGPVGLVEFRPKLQHAGYVIQIYSRWCEGHVSHLPVCRLDHLERRALHSRRGRVPPLSRRYDDIIKVAYLFKTEDIVCLGDGGEFNGHDLRAESTGDEARAWMFFKRVLFMYGARHCPFRNASVFEFRDRVTP